MSKFCRGHYSQFQDKYIQSLSLSLSLSLSFSLSLIDCTIKTGESDGRSTWLRTWALPPRQRGLWSQGALFGTNYLISNLDVEYYTKNGTMDQVWGTNLLDRSMNHANYQKVINAKSNFKVIPQFGNWKTEWRESRTGHW